MGELKNKLGTLFRTGFFHIFGGSVINKIVSFFSSVLLVRILTKQEYGVFTYGWNIYSLLALFGGLGLTSGVLQLSSERSGDLEYTNRISRYATRLGLSFDLCLCFFILAVSFFIPLKIPESRRVLFSVCLLPAVVFLANMSEIYLRSLKRNQEYAKLLTAYTITVAVASNLGAIFFRELGMVIGQYIAALAAFLIARFFFHIKLIDFKASGIGDDRKPLLRISLVALVNNSLVQLMYLLDVFVLGIVDPQATILASYKVATVIPTAFTFIPQSLVLYLYPYFAEHKDDGQWCLSHYKKIVLGFGLFNLLLAAVMFALAPLVIRIVHGSAYLDSVPVFRILMINYFFSATFRTLSVNLLISQRKLGFNLFVAVFSSLINIAADYFLITWMGSIGAALATLTVMLVASVLSTSFLVITFRNKARPAAASV